MGAEFDINALLDTDFTKQLIEEANKNTAEIITTDKNEVAKRNTSDLQEALVNGALTNIKKIDSVLEDAFADAQTAPGDPETIDSLTKLINARTKLMSSLQAVYLNQDKFKQNLILTKMRLDAQYQMNQENNETKITLTREAVLKKLMEESKNDKIINIRDNAGYKKRTQG